MKIRSHLCLLNDYVIIKTDNIGKGIPSMSNESLLLQPIQVGNLTLKNRIMFPPLTTGYEERDGSIGERSLAFYERLAKGPLLMITYGLT